MNLSAVPVMATLAPPSGKQPTTPTAKPISKLPAECLIVFGLDNNDRPHASWFGDGDMGLARKAAEMMGMAAVDVTSEALRALAGQLPAGRVFASGKAFVPFVKGGVYSQLAAHLPKRLVPPAGAGAPANGRSIVAEAREMPARTSHKAPERDQGNEATSPAEIDPRTPSSPAESGSDPAVENNADATPQNAWSAIKVGELVLAKEEGDGEGWYEARVLNIRGDLFTVKWRDWPEMGKLVRRSEHIALLHPTYIAASD